MFVLGLILIWIGLLLVIKKKITLLHKYHYDKVDEKEYDAYTKSIGIPITYIGFSLIISAFINYFLKTYLGFIYLAISFIGAIIYLIKGQKKYQGGII